MCDLEKIVEQFVIDFPDKHIVLSKVEATNEKYVNELVLLRDTKERSITKHYMQDNDLFYKQIIGKYNNEFDVYMANREDVEWYNPCPS